MLSKNQLIITLFELVTYRNDISYHTRSVHIFSTIKLIINVYFLNKIPPMESLLTHGRPFPFVH